MIIEKYRYIVRVYPHPEMNICLFDTMENKYLIEYGIFNREDEGCHILFRTAEYFNNINIAHQIDFQLYDENLKEYIETNG